MYIHDTCYTFRHKNDNSVSNETNNRICTLSSRSVYRSLWYMDREIQTKSYPVVGKTTTFSLYNLPCIYGLTNVLSSFLFILISITKKESAYQISQLNVRIERCIVQWSVCHWTWVLSAQKPFVDSGSFVSKTVWNWSFSIIERDFYYMYIYMYYVCAFIFQICML